MIRYRRTLLPNTIVVFALLLCLCITFGASAFAARVVVTHWQHHDPARAAAVREFVKEFEAENPDIKIDFQSIPWSAYFDKLNVALSTNKGPDVCQIPCGLVLEYISGGKLSKVPKSVMTADAARKEYVPYTVDRLVIGNDLYGFPTDVQTIVLFYNATLFSEAGINPDSPPKTWDELIEYAKKLTKRDSSGKLVQCGYDATTYPITLEAYMLQNGAKILSDDYKKLLWNSPEGLEAFEFMTNFYTKYKISDLKFVPDAFTLGKTAITQGHPVLMGYLRTQAPKLNYRLALLPAPTGKKTVTSGTYWAYVVPNYSSHKDAAWKWIRFLTDKVAQKKWFQRSGDLPSLVELSTDPQFTQDARLKVALESMHTAKLLSWIGWAEWVKLGTDMAERVIIKGESPKVSLDKATAEGNAILAKKAISLEELLK